MHPLLSKVSLTMSTIASSEYGDRSGAELLKMSRSEIGSGEIDVNVVLPSGSKRERNKE